MTTTVKISYSVQEAAAAVGLSPDSLRAAIRSGDLVAKYPTARPVILHDDLYEWINAAPSRRTP